LKENEGTQDLSVDIPVGKNFVTLGVEEKNGKRKYKALWGWRFK
jgi:hypothetical protein